MIYSVGLDNTVGVTNCVAGKRVKQFTHPELNVNCQMARISVDPMGGFVAVGSSNGAVVVFSLLGGGEEEEEKVRVLRFHKGAVTATACAANMIVAGDQQGCVSFWT
jgi:hypothetical protein